MTQDMRHERFEEDCQLTWLNGMLLLDFSMIPAIKLTSLSRLADGSRAKACFSWREASRKAVTAMRAMESGLKMAYSVGKRSDAWIIEVTPIPKADRLAFEKEIEAFLAKEGITTRLSVLASTAGTN